MVDINEAVLPISKLPVTALVEQANKAFFAGDVEVYYGLQNAIDKVVAPYAVTTPWVD